MGQVSLLDGAPPDVAVDESASSFSRGLRSSGTILKADIANIAARGAETLGFDDYAKERYARAEALHQQAQAEGPTITKTSDIKGVRDAWDYGTGLLGSSALAAGAGIAGGFLGKTPLGRLAGATAATVPFTAASTIAQQQADPGQAAAPVGLRNLVGAPQAVGQAAIMNVLPQFMMGKVLSKAKAPVYQSTGEIVGKNLLEGVGGNAAAGAAVAKVGQIGGTMVNPNRDTTHDESEMIEGAVAGGTLGAAMSPLGIVGEKFHNRNLKPPVPDPNAPKPPKMFPSGGDRTAVNLDTLRADAAEMGRSAIQRVKDLVSDEKREPTDLDKASRIVEGRDLTDEVRLAEAAPGEGAMEVARKGVQDTIDTTTKWAKGIWDDFATPENQAKLGKVVDDVTSGAGELYEKGTQSAKDLYNDYVTPENRAKLETALGDMGNKANQVFVAGLQKEKELRTQALKKADELMEAFKETPVEGDGEKRSGSTAGARVAVAHALVDATGNRLTALHSDAVTEALDGMQSSGTVTPRQADKLIRALGRDAGSILSEVHQKVASGTSEVRTEKFYKALKELAQYQYREHSQAEAVRAALPPEVAKSATPEHIDEMVQHLQNHAAGKHSAHHGKEQTAHYEAGFTEAMKRTFGEKSEALLEKFAQDHALANKVKYERAPAPGEEKLEPTDAEVAKGEHEWQMREGDSLEETIETHYLGGGNDKKKPEPIPTVAKHRSEFNNKGAAERLMEEAKVNFPGRIRRWSHAIDTPHADEVYRQHLRDNDQPTERMNPVTKKREEVTYAERGHSPEEIDAAERTQADLKDKGFVTVLGAKDATRLTAGEMKRMTLNSKLFSKSKNRIGTASSGMTLDAIRMMKLMREKFDEEWTGADRQGYMQRTARMFFEGIAAASDYLGKAIPDVTKEHNAREALRASGKKVPETPLNGYHDGTVVDARGTTVGDLKKVEFRPKDPKWIKDLTKEITTRYEKGMPDDMLVGGEKVGALRKKGMIEEEIQQRHIDEQIKDRFDAKEELTDRDAPGHSTGDPTKGERTAVQPGLHIRELDQTVKTLTMRVDDLASDRIEEMKKGKARVTKARVAEVYKDIRKNTDVGKALALAEAEMSKRQRPDAANTFGENAGGLVRGKLQARETEAAIEHFERLASQEKDPTKRDQILARVEELVKQRDEYVELARATTPMDEGLGSGRYEVGKDEQIHLVDRAHGEDIVRHEGEDKKGNTQELLRTVGKDKDNKPIEQVTALGRQAIENRIRSFETNADKFPAKRNIGAMARQLNKIFGQLKPSEQQELVRFAQTSHDVSGKPNDAKAMAIITRLAKDHGITPPKWYAKGKGPQAVEKPLALHEQVAAGGESLKRVIEMANKHTDVAALQRGLDEIFNNQSKHSGEALRAINARIEKLVKDNPEAQYQMGLEHPPVNADKVAVDTIATPEPNLKAISEALSEETKQRMNDIVQQVAGDVVGVIHENGKAGATTRGRFTIDQNGKALIRFFTNMVKDSDGERLAHHESAHAVMAMIAEIHGPDVAKKVLALADQEYIRAQIDKLKGEGATYYVRSPEELFVEAYAQWATGKLQLKEAPLLERVFKHIQSFFGQMSDEKLLATVFRAIKDGEARDAVGMFDTNMQMKRLEDNDVVTGRGVKPTKEQIAVLRAELGPDAAKFAHDNLSAAEFTKLKSAAKSPRIRNNPEWLNDIGESIVRPHDSEIQARKDAAVAELKQQIHMDDVDLLHASPHTFDKFDWNSHMGRGEGNQAFGYGGYFASAAEAGKHYQDMFTPSVKRPKFAGWRFDEAVATLKDANRLDILNLPERESKKGGAYVKYDAVKRLLKETDKSGEFDGPAGATALDRKAAAMINAIEGGAYDPAAKKAPLYKVKAALEPHEIMNYDKSLDQQPDILKAIRGNEKLASALSKFIDLPAGTKDTFSNWTGKRVYDTLSLELGSDRAVSEALDAAGIKGHKYLDGDGRKASDGEGGHNYVIYDAKHVKINDVSYSHAKTDPNRVAGPRNRKLTEEYIEKVLGKSVDIEWADMLHAGEFVARAGDPKRPGTKDLIRLSIHALDPSAVGAHEALHGFMEQLRASGDHEINKVLFRAADTFHVREQLRKEFANEPEILKQIESSSEERAAYMYQLYIKDPSKMKLGPQTQGAIERIAKFFRGVLGIMSNDERALQIMDYLHSGEYGKNMGDRGRVTKDLSTGLNPTIERAKTFLKPLGRLADSIAASGDSRLRDSDNPALMKIADLMHSHSTASARGERGSDTGFIAVSREQATRTMNDLTRRIGMHDKDTLTEALTALQAGEEPKSAGAKAAAIEIRKTLDERYRYMKDAGVVLGDRGYGKDYFPVVWSPDALTRKADDFRALLQTKKDAGTFKGDIEQTLSMLISRDGAEEGVARFQPSNQFAKERVLDMLTAAEREPFLEKNLHRALHSYVTQATRRAEWSRRFKDDNSGLVELLNQAKRDGADDHELATARRYISAVNGTLGDNLSPTMRRLFGNTVVYQNIRLLPLAIFSSVIDPVGIVVRGGTMKQAWDTFGRGIKEIPRGFKDADNQKADAGYALAEAMGTIDNAILQHTVGTSYSQGMVGDFGRNVNEKFFKWNLMEQYNRSMRVGATEAAKMFLAKHGDGVYSRHSDRYLAELGLKKGDVEYKGADPRTPTEKFENKVDTRDPLLTIDDFIDAGYSPAEAAKKSNVMAAAINKWVDGAVLRPNAAHKTIWMNDPHFALVAHLKQFTYSFQENILKRTWNEAKHGNYTPAMALASYVPIMMAADFTKGMIQGGGSQPDWKAGWSLGDYVSSGVQRAGLYGSGQFLSDAVTHRSGLGGLAGPTIEQLASIVNVAGGREQFANFALKAMPANALYMEIAGNKGSAGMGVNADPTPQFNR